MFKALAKETDTLILETKVKLQDSIIALLAIEIQTRISNIAALAVDGVNICAKIALIKQSKSINLEIFATQAAFTALLLSIATTSTIPEENLMVKLETKSALPGGSLQDAEQDQVPLSVCNRT